MNLTEITDLQRRLAQFNQRFCGCCKGTFPLTEQYWYFSRKGRVRKVLRPSNNCRNCTRLINAERDRKRYQQDKRYRERKSKYAKAYQANPVNRQRQRDSSRAWKRRQRAAALRAGYSRLLPGATS